MVKVTVLQAMVVHHTTSALLVVVLLLWSPSLNCRKSDYKRLILSDVVSEELEDLFHAQMETLEKSKSKDSVLIKRLYERYLEMYSDYFLHRLQPSAKVGSKHTITLDGNRRRNLTVETISKRRPLIFQIDDFLSHEECDHIVTLATQQGLNVSQTGGDQLQDIGRLPDVYDEIGLLEFGDADTDGDGYANATELKTLFKIAFQNKLSLVLVYDIMKQTQLDFDRDGRVAEWEWNSKNTTRLVMMLNDTVVLNPASRVRHSRQTWLDHTYTEDPVLESIQDRLHQLTGIPIPMLRGSEELQVVRYIPGGHYDCHLDSDPRYYPSNAAPCCHLVKSTESEDAAKDCSSCRFMTILYYLDDPESGGETAFPVAGVDPQEVLKGYSWDDENLGSGESWCDLSVHCKEAAVRVVPKKGRAVLWYNHFLHPDTNWTGPVDPNSLHGGCAVHKGKKWIANNWINAGFKKEHDILSWARSAVWRIIERRKLEKKRED